MSTKQNILEYGKDIIVGSILIAYLMSDIKTPELLNDGAGNMMGLVAIGMIVLLTFTLFHPIVGVLAIILVFKLIANEGKNIKHTPVTPIESNPINTEIDSDFNTRVSVTPQDTVVIKSTDTTLEQEVISKMAPINKQSLNNDTTVKPVMTNLNGVSSIS